MNLKYLIDSENIVYVLILLITCATSQPIYTGNNFTSSQSGVYENAILQCDDNADCTIDCDSDRGCYNATIFCPSTMNKCTILCDVDMTTPNCDYLDIHWIQGNVNTLTCGIFTCARVPYPPPIDDNTEYLVNCNTKGACSGTIITCPDNAKCVVVCSGWTSCVETVINCPSTAQCNVYCNDTDSCIAASVIWSSDHSLAYLDCPWGGYTCNYINPPSYLNPINNNSNYTFICDGSKECASSTINCPTNADCQVNCIDFVGCSGATINCPQQNGECRIICGGKRSCYYTTFNGPTDNNLYIDCTDSSSCNSASIYAKNVAFLNFTADNGDGSTPVRAASFWFPANNGTSTKIFMLLVILVSMLLMDMIQFIFMQ